LQFLKEGRSFGEVGQRLHDVPFIVEKIYVWNLCSEYRGKYRMHPKFLIRMRHRVSGEVLIWETTTWSEVAPGRKGVLSDVVHRHLKYYGIKRTELRNCRLRLLPTT
jgi:hypothetical protein